MMDSMITTPERFTDPDIWKPLLDENDHFCALCFASKLDNIGAKKSTRRSDIFFIIIVARICIVCFYRPETASGCEYMRPTPT